ncbi:carboxymuconolactone decarboxylase family protein [Conexibacter sp. CPCC 206217]|uniref:carboxymuconolactone decarboxylase family protein n=1 Tax=Conexibacter sp. CPCC 206217 TaxID=3064574 RepID=UPI00271E1B85|nr:carboxymuconolactone decarboxylase family protein [Conexibacter sp. CPCC 206217]MDO8214206.1 carboxymuconolactone decarboxylase family protein [Conexibacter sp. CPCC 206217]
MKTDELLRRLALNDEEVVRSAIADAPRDAARVDVPLDERTVALVRLAALLAVGAAVASCRVAVERARAAGAGDEQLAAVLLAVGPAVGAARLVDAAPRLALALDHEIEGVDTPGPGARRA